MSKYVIALGGSVAFPEKINTDFFSNFYSFIKERIKKGDKFIIISGGGFIARKYGEAASKITDISDEDKDWIGIHATRLNAQFLRNLFKKEADSRILKARKKIKDFNNNSVIIGAGWNPGYSTDFVAVQSAIDFNIENIIILGKPDYVYTDDFEKNKNAKPIKEMTWEEYLDLIPDKWTPGLSSPVDPVAARLAKKENVKVTVAEGKDLKNLEKIIRREDKFKGTVIKG